MSEQRRSRTSRRPRIGPNRIRQIEALLAGDFSPEQSAGGRLLSSHEWVYRDVHAGRKCGGRVIKRLRKRRRRPDSKLPLEVFFEDSINCVSNQS